jgi:DNA (cytosine-5)-methyltransferase 1
MIAASKVLGAATIHICVNCSCSGGGKVGKAVLAKNDSSIKFVDFCAGLGGFHQALSQVAKEIFQSQQLKFECVAASEIEDDLRECYAQNFPDIIETYAAHHLPQVDAAALALRSATREELKHALPDFDANGAVKKVHGDLFVFLNDDASNLRTIAGGVTLLPRHDLLCAGFPCQPFSKSGAQKGFEDTRGTVFHALAIMTRELLPAFLLLENVGNFPRHDNGNTWRRVKKILQDLGYEVMATEPISSGPDATGLMSPHHRGYPHHRERFFILAQRRKALTTDSDCVRNLLAVPLSARAPARRASRSRTDETVVALEKIARNELTKIITKPKSENEAGALVSAQLSADHTQCINHWGKLLEKLGEHDKATGTTNWRDTMPSFPIWGYELDPWHWYPIDSNPAARVGQLEIVGSFGNLLLDEAASAVGKSTGGSVSILDYPPNGDRAWLRRPLGATQSMRWIASWPSYAASRGDWPDWKVRFITQNREWALKLWAALDPKWLRGWLDELYDVIAVPSLQKLEWNCKGEELDIWNHILQFRPSGLRVKRLGHVPALVAMTTTQIPIIPRLNTTESLKGATVGAKGRHLLPSEALQLQGFPPDWYLPQTRERAFTCFGNAVHAGLVKDLFLDWLFPSVPPRNPN